MSVHMIAAVGVFAIPIFGVFLLRYLRTRLTAAPFYSIGGGLYALAALAAILLVRDRIETVQFGNLVLTQPQGIDVQLPFEALTPQPTSPPAATPATQATLATPPTVGSPTIASPSPTARPTFRDITAFPTATRTAAATATPTPGSPTASPTASPAPTDIPPTASPEPTAGQRTYTVQPGDTLRSIAEDFGVSVQQIIEANDLSQSEADDLQPGDTLIIP